MDHNLLQAQLEAIFNGENAGGDTANCDILFVGPNRVAEITRRSTCGGDATTVRFRPHLPLEEALVYVKRYKEKGTFKHGNEPDRPGDSD